MRGQIFELEGYRFFTMGGARSHDIEDGILELDDPNFERKLLMLRRKPRARFRINHISWWEQELPSDEEYAEARRNLGRCGWQADYIITHCAPISTAMMESRHNEADELTEFFQEVKEKAEYCTGAHKTVWRKSFWLNTSRTPEESADSSDVLLLYIGITASCTHTSGIHLFRSEQCRTGGSDPSCLPACIPGMQHSRRW